MLRSSPRVAWMKQMLSHCFGKNQEDGNRINEDGDLTENLVNFLQGKMGQTLLVYYQKPIKLNEKNEKVETSSMYIIYYNQQKNIELRNKAAFFMRKVEEGREFSQGMFQIPSDEWLVFGEITSDSIVGMNKVIYNYLYQKFDEVAGEGVTEVEPEQRSEFKKILETFATDMQDTVESLISGVKFTEIPPNIREFIQKGSKENFVRDEESENMHRKIEDIYQSWIDTLTKENEDVDKEVPINTDDEGPRRELEKWKFRMQRLTKVNDFFKSQDYRTIVTYFTDKKGQTRIQHLTGEMKNKRTEAHSSHSQAKDIVKYLSTLEIYFEPLYNGTPETIIDSLQSLMNSLKLISFTASYYDNTNMSNLFSRITEQMICNCKDYILDRKKNRNNHDPTYLWSRQPSELVAKFQICIRLLHVYREKYAEAKANSTSTNKENNFEFGEYQLFGKFEQFCKRLSKLIDLFTTIKQFEDIKNHKLDSMESIEMKYEKQLNKFQSVTSHLLHYSDTKFDKDYVAFNLAISEIENELHKIINEEFKKLHWIEKKLKLLAKYEKILTKPNLQQNLKSEKIEIYSNYKREIDSIQTNFESGRTSPKLQRNMPKISGKIKWARHLFNRIYPYINNFKDISIKERSETELSYMTTTTLLYSYIILNENFFVQFVESAKAKLSAPLLVISETTGPRVNLDLYVLQLIREAKCMLRMNSGIPEAAKIILLQEDKFKKYYNELNFLVKEYNRVLSRIGKPEAENYFRAHIKDLNLKLQPLKTTVNWSSMNIDTNLMSVFACLQKFEYAIDAFNEVLENRVHRNMLSIRKLELLHIPENATTKSIGDILKKQEDGVKDKNLLLMNKNTEIEIAILDIIEGIKNYEVDPKISKVDDKVLFKLIYDYEEKFYDFLMTATKNSLISLKERITSKNGNSIFKVDVVLSSNTIEISPKVSVIQETINKLAKSVIFAMVGINRWTKPDSKEMTSFHTQIGKDNEIVRMILLLTGSVTSNNIEIEKYLNRTFDPFRNLWTDSIEKRIKEFNNKKNKTYFDYEAKLKEYSAIERSIKSIPEEKHIGAICLNTKAIKSTLETYCLEWKNAYSKELLRTTRASAKELNELITNFQQKLNKKVEKIEELKEIVDTIEQVRKNEANIEMQIKPFVQLYNLVKQHTKESDFDRYNFPNKETFDYKWKEVLFRSGEIRDLLQKDQVSYKKKLYDDVKNLKVEVTTLKSDYDLNGPTKAKNPIDAHERIEKFRTRVGILNRAWKNIKDGEKLFNISSTDYPQLKEIEDDLVVYGTLYDLYMAVLRQIDSWKDMQWSDVPAAYDEMERKCSEFGTASVRVNKRLWGTQEYAQLKEQIKDCTQTTEAFKILISTNYEEIHWKEIAEETKVKEAANVKTDGGMFKLKLFFDARIHEHQVQLEDIQSAAQSQEKIKIGLKNIDETWRTLEFQFEQHQQRKEVYMIKSLPLQDIKNILEEHSAKVAGMKSQRNLPPDLQQKVKGKESTFQNIINTIELWQSVQTLWSNLQSFFIGGDIQKDLPSATAQFKNADKEWVKLMNKAFDMKLVNSLCSGSEMSPQLTEIDGVLKYCQKLLDFYLESKRGAFPRFYFVSNSVLLDILSKKTEPANIRSNLNIIFDAITDIEFHPMDKKTIVTIKQTKSESNTRDIQLVDISNYAVKCDGKIEDWLNELVRSMQLSLRDLFDLCYIDVRQYFDVPIAENNKESFQKFIMHYICQVSLFGLQVLGTRKLEEYVVRYSVEKPETYRKRVHEGLEKDPVSTDLNNILAYLADLCRKEHPNKLEVIKLETLIIVHVHNKDIFSFLTNTKENPNRIFITDYDWLKQTRVYWYENKSSGVKTCLINITDVPFEYGYEFLGAKERMCITKLTDKCYITLAQALGMNYGGAPAGPAGTGKTETVKDMGRTMGVFVLVTNCAPEHKYKEMATIFKGLCKSGAWGCFDEFNRIELETLSVVARIVSTIQDCRKQMKPSFKFPEFNKDGVNPDCELLATTAYFITMNPGYSGRQELPENLKVLFRGVTMMLPNRLDIIRVKLSSYGFDRDEDLSQKFTKLYSLCEDQLSKQKHYDFGLRNILSVLRHAGNVKKLDKNPDKEEKILYKALRGMNESKLVPDDINLFVSLINDVFPAQAKEEEKGAKDESQEDEDIRLRIIKVMTERMLDVKEEWVKKVIQTYQTYFVRHGFMIVGDTGSGKTTIMDVLTAAMSDDPKNREAKWKIHRMNPKAVEADYLYIQKVIDQYHLGIFTRLWQKCNNPNDKLNNWLVCDGPIDSIWIESLNTVLDDNKILTLPNNDRISMIDNCRLVFECENLRNATLATVSRAGMIYITENELSARPLISSWFLRNEDLLKDANNVKKTVLKELIEKKYLANDILNEFDKTITLCMHVSWIVRVKNFLLLVQAMLTHQRDNLDKSYLEKIVIFSFVWGIGGLLELEQRKALHRLLQKYKAPLPEMTDDTTIFEYRVGDSGWELWKTEEYDNLKGEMGNFSNLLVPTMDSTRAIFLIERIGSVKIEGTERTHPCLLLGDAGTAKTSTILLYKKLKLVDKSGGEKKRVLKRVNFSSATTPTNFQVTVDDELEKQGTDYVPMFDKFMTVFIDDLSMPYVNKNGDQVTLELVRQLLEFGSYYHIESDIRGQLKKMNRLSFVSAMNHPKGGKNDIPNRLKRHFFMFNMVLPNQQSINDIYGKIVTLWYSPKEYGETIAKQAQYLTSLTSELLARMKKKFIPTPIKFHYNFNMRELSRTFQGIFQADKAVMKSSNAKLGITSDIYLILLWRHEVTRVFCDKLRDADDKKEYTNILDSVLTDTFDKEAADKMKEDFIFCDYLRDVEIDQELGREKYVKAYEMVKTIDMLKERSEKFMNDLKSVKGKKQVNLVLFEDCLRYLVRITRIIQTPQGTCMLVGVGGSGKQSLTRLGSFCCQHEIVQLGTDRADRLEELKTEFRTIYTNMVEKYNPSSGADILRYTFLMTDAEIKLESFLELVSSFLSTGEIANLFAKKEDKQAIILSTRAMLAKMKDFANKEPDENEVWIALINIVKDNLHLSLCFSPSSDKFREKFIKFPVLFNNSTIIWLLPWPEDALLSVIQGFVKANSRLVLEGKEEHKRQLFQHIAGVHVKIQQVCEQYLHKMRKYVYVTPKSYLSFIEEYIKIYITKKEEISIKETTINTGLDKLEKARKDIAKLNIELGVQMKALEEKKREVEEKELELRKESEKVAEIEAVVNAEADKCAKDKEAIEIEKEMVLKELKEAEPALEDAERKMNEIDKDVVTNIGQAGVSPMVRFYFECATIIMNKRLQPIFDFGRVVLNNNFTVDAYTLSWELCIGYIKSQSPNSFANTLNLWKVLIKQNNLNINDETLELIRPYLESKCEDKLVFDADAAEKAAGPPGRRLAGFCRAVTSYVIAVKEVMPKKKLVDEKEQQLKIALEKLEEQLEKKRKVIEDRMKLEESLNAVKREKDLQEEEASKMKQKVDTASNLIESLAGERVRWSEDSKLFDQNKKALLGNSAICAAFLAYAGPFNSEFRNNLIRETFRGDIVRRGIPLTEDLILEDFLVDEPTKGEWVMNKLPSDTLSIQNGILVQFSSRYPLLIDPQNQAKAWLLTTFPEIESNHQMRTQKYIADKFELFLVPLLNNGDKVIVEGIENEVDSKLDPILDKQIKPGNTKIKKLIVGEKEIDFNENFKMYMLCKLITPHFTPELAAKTTIIDFCVTFEGLEQQLQGLVISKEQKSLEETLKAILSSITQNKNSLIICQKEILDNLNKEGSLMDNQDIIGVLNNSKTKSDENNRKIKEAEEKKIDINQKREKYLPVATRGAVIYFSIVDMQEISKMYSSSLQQFESLFVYSIEKANEGVPMNNTEQRVKSIVKYLTKHVYKYVVRGLFERDKTAFILNVCFKILTREKYEGTTPLKGEDISHFIKAGATLLASAVEDCSIDSLSSKGDTKPKEWMNVKALVNWKFNANNQVFMKLIEKIRDGSDLPAHKDPFRVFFNAPDAEKKIPFDDLYNQSNPKLAAFYKLFFVRALREDRTIIAATSHFIPTVLDDKDFLEASSETVEDIFNITEPRIPILYLLSAGADPTSGIEYLAAKKRKKISQVSMGEGQDPIASSCVDAAKSSGDWVLLQNCHLGLGFMNALDAILKNTDTQFHPEMRIWLSCEPRNEFPIGLLHQSLKITNEPPKGIKAGMTKTFSSVVNQEMIDKYDFRLWKDIIFTLAFLHSLVLERRKYGPLGWCIPYDFNNSDLEASILFVDKQFQKGFILNDKKKPEEMIDYGTLKNVVSSILYGGRITDKKDEELFFTMIDSYIKKDFLEKQQPLFLSSTNKSDPKAVSMDYTFPQDNLGKTQEFLTHLKNFPTNDPAQVFGLHGSAEMTFRLKEFNELLMTIGSTQPKDGGGDGAMSKEDTVKNIVKQIKIPEPFIEKDYRAKIDNLSMGGLYKGLQVPLNNVLLQEVMSIQGIINLVTNSLSDIKEALEGRLMMTEDIVRCINSLYDAKPPNSWLFDVMGNEISWLSPYAGDWILGLQNRAERLREWLNSGKDQRPAFYLPGILNPQGFFAAFKQEVFKILKGSQNITLDDIDLKFEPHQSETDPKQYEKIDRKKAGSNTNKFCSMIVYGIFIEGAIWNGVLQDDPDVNSRTPIVKFPVINVIGGIVDNNNKTQSGVYPCPLYKYPKRTDKYHIIDVGLKISGSESSEKNIWQKRGVALLCNKE